MMEPGNRTHPIDFSATVPAARPLSDFSIEQVGDDLVILDGETLQYHTLNQTAAWIWRACDGVTSAAQMAAEVGIPVEVVEATIAELGEVGLLQSPSNQWDSTLNRRRAAKLIAAGLVGVVGLPVIKSITAPDSAAAYTRNQCLAIPGAIGLCTAGNFTCTLNCVAAHNLSWYGQCVSGGTGNARCCVCHRWIASVGDEELVIDDTAGYQEAGDGGDPYLGDADGNVDLNAVQTDSVEQPVEAETIPPTDVPVDEVQSAPVDDGASSDGSTDSSATDSDPVDTSSGEDAPTAAANG